jgi:ABC-type sugar transport system ATPase subunit
VKDRNILEVIQASKSFANIEVLHTIDFSLKAGEVHALVGENGAGKSTLLKILSGVYRADSGEVRIDGNPVKIHSPSDAHNAGFSIIYQELVLANCVSVYENILLGAEPRKFGFYDKKKAIALSKVYLQKVKADINPSTKVGDLSTAMQQLVEIARALSRNSRIIAMDEPTSSLTETEIEALFSLIIELKAQGHSIIYVSHRMEEIFRIADRVTVMRDGRMIQTLDIKDCNKGKIINLMIGKEVNVVESSREDRPRSSTRPILEVKSLASRKLKDISFELFPGEVLGLAGLVGAGRSTLLNTLMGMYKIDSGEVIFNGKRFELVSPAKIIKSGIGIVPENRKTDGLFLNMSMKHNLAMIQMNKLGKFGFQNKKAEQLLAEHYMEELDIRPRISSHPALSISGGNQQKIVIGKWLAFRGLKMLLLDEPTRGIDVGSKFFIHALIRRLAERGLPILVASSELPELLEICDRILVMKNGKITKELKRSEADKETILSYAF